jgi:hypothetical protein
MGHETAPVYPPVTMITFPPRSGIWSAVKRVAGGKTSLIVCHNHESAIATVKYETTRRLEAAREAV